WHLTWAPSSISFIRQQSLRISRINQRRRGMEHMSMGPTALPDAHAENLVGGHAHRWNTLVRASIAMALWVIGLIALYVVAVLIRNHPGPWPLELAFTRTIQHLPS